MEYAMMRVVPGSTEHFAEKLLVTTLTPKQREAAGLTAQGVTNEVLADKPGISVSCVKQALQAISEKMSVGQNAFLAFL